MTSSPSPMPNTRRVISKAVVAALKQTVLSLPQYSVILFSNSLVFGPVVIQPDFKALITSSISSSLMSGGENGMFMFYSPLTSSGSLYVGTHAFIVSLTCSLVVPSSFKSSLNMSSFASMSSMVKSMDSVINILS